MTKDSTYSRKSLKRRLIKEGIIKNECALCGQGPNWKGKKMSLILDHINGINNDNRLENLRIVCPNCNATLPTHAGRNIKHTKKENKCLDCKETISKNAIRCKKHAALQQKNKIKWPSDDELKKLVWQKPKTILSKELGVSDKAIAKRCNQRKISQPPKGYWNKSKKISYLTSLRKKQKT
jgi:Zn finger protein HypA/HybF involved in hydrogenase expression